MAAQAHAGGDGLERRAVGLPTSIGTTFSLIVASTSLATAAGGFFASWVWLIALALAFVTIIFAAMSFSEMATMIPKAGSMNEYVRAGLGPFFATITVAVGYIAVYREAEEISEDIGAEIDPGGPHLHHPERDD